MPPPSLNPRQTADTGHMLARPKPSGEGGLPVHQERSGLGSVVGIIIILVLLAFGALYFWGAYLNRKSSVELLPFIPGDNSTQQTG